MARVHLRSDVWMTRAIVASMLVAALGFWYVVFRHDRDASKARIEQLDKRLQQLRTQDQRIADESKQQSESLDAVRRSFDNPIGYK
ncbi:MAG: hypothetical protein AB7G11_06765 [Phycisphaerales bacterium]